MSSSDQVQQAIDLLESQRANLGDDVVDAALAPLLLKRTSAPSPTSPEGRGARKFVTVMFADISGFTALSESLDPEAVRDLMNECFEHLAPAVLHYDGTIDKFLGDGMMVLFGAPATHENDPERALRTALEMMDDLRQFNSTHDLNLGLHFGINTGMVVAGGLGTHDRQGYSVLGDVVNVAARLEHASERGEILVGPETYRLAAPFFEFDTLTPLQMKGKREPVPAYRLRRAKSTPGKTRGIVGLDSPMVGRVTQLSAFQEKITKVRNGQGSIVTLWGEAGLGKSRLVSEARAFAQELQKPSVHWVEGRCLSYGSTIAYLPWLEILRRMLSLNPETAPEKALSTLRLHLQNRCPDVADELYPLLGHLLSLPLDEPAEEKLRSFDATTLKSVTFRAIETFLTRVATQSPLVIVGEDLHWADPTSLALWQDLFLLTESSPILLVLVMRPEREHGSWRLRHLAAEGYPAQTVDLSIEPLSAAESETLVGHLLHIQQLPLELREKILKHAEGNPFYTEEIIRSLMDSHAIAFDETSGLWHATRPVNEIELPDTLQGVLMARIDRLQTDTKRVLQLAAVIGRSFMYRVLAQIATEEQNLDSRLDALLDQQMIRERARLPELEYIFKHQLTQEAAYNGLLKKERLDFHLQVAQALEKLFADRIDEMVGLLAYHWERAGNNDKALEYFQRAGELAFAQFANAEAATYYEKALAILPAEKQPERFRLLCKLIIILDYLGERERDAEVIKQIAELAETANNDTWRCEAILREAHLAWNQGQFDEANAKAQEAIQLGKKLGNPDFQARGYFAWGRSSMYQGQYEQALNVLQLALPLARQSGNRLMEGNILRNLGNNYSFITEYEQARTHIEEALSIHREQNDITNQAAALNTLGIMANSSGDRPTALTYFLESLKLYQQSGYSFGCAMLQQNLADYYFSLGEYQQALDYAHQAQTGWKRTGNYDGFATVEDEIGRIYLQMEELEIAHQHFQQALRYREKSPNLVENANLMERFGWIAENQRQYDKAHDYFEKALEIWQQLDIRVNQIRISSILAFIDYRQGRLDASEACLRQLLEEVFQSDSLPFQYLKEILQRGLAQASWAKGNCSAALDLANNAFEIAVELNDSLEQASSKILMGLALIDLNNLNAAETAFSEALAILRTRPYPPISQADALAGLIQISAACGETAKVISYLAEMQPLLQKNPQLYGALEPERALQTVAQYSEP